MFLSASASSVAESSEAASSGREEADGAGEGSKLWSWGREENEVASPSESAMKLCWQVFMSHSQRGGTFEMHCTGTLTLLQHTVPLSLLDVRLCLVALRRCQRGVGKQECCVQCLGTLHAALHV